MKEYRRQAARIRAEIEAGLQEYEQIREDLCIDRRDRRRVARCGTFAGEPALWFYRSLVFVAQGRLPDLAHRAPASPRAMMLH